VIGEISESQPDPAPRARQTQRSRPGRLNSAPIDPE